MFFFNVRMTRYFFSLEYDAKHGRRRHKSNECAMMRVLHTRDQVDGSSRDIDNGIVAFGPAAFNFGAQKIAYFIVDCPRSCIGCLHQSGAFHSPDRSKRGICRCGLAAE